MSPVTSTLENSLVPFCRAPQLFLLQLARTHGPVAPYRLDDALFASVSDPEIVNAVLHGSLEDFEKGPLYDVVRAMFGNGLFTAEGEDWTGQHAVIAPMFARHRIRQLGLITAGLTARQVDRWRQRGDHEDDDVLITMKRLAFDVVTIAFFNLYDVAEREAIFETMYRLDRLPLVAFKYLSERLPLDQLAAAILDRGATSTVAMMPRLDELLYGIVERRLAGRDDADDVLGALVGSSYFKALTPKKRRVALRDNIASLLTAGYVSTGESLFWSLYHLARHPEAQVRARSEVLAADSPLLDAPRFLAAVFNESMRLYPPAWYIGRTTRRALQIGGLEVLAGTQVVCSPYVLHRMPALWPNPDVFVPERFLPDSPVVPRSFIPFSSGPRACLGRSLALMELTSLLSATLAAFEIQLVSDGPITLAPTYSMQPREPVRFRLRPRS